MGATKEIPPGKSKIVNVGNRSIGVYNIKGEYFAIKNVCPHQQAPLCLGEVTGMMLPCRPGEFIYGRDGEIVRCPWHGWEFDIKTGRSVFNPHRVRVRSYEVTVESGGGVGSAGRSESNGSNSRDESSGGSQVGDAQPDSMLEPEDPSVETYEVTVEEEMVVLHL